MIGFLILLVGVIFTIGICTHGVLHFKKENEGKLENRIIGGNW